VSKRLCTACSGNEALNDHPWCAHCFRAAMVYSDWRQSCITCKALKFRPHHTKAQLEEALKGVNVLLSTPDSVGAKSYQENKTILENLLNGKNKEA
jgi:hypothetical protein